MCSSLIYYITLWTLCELSLHSVFTRKRLWPFMKTSSLASREESKEHLSFSFTVVSGCLSEDLLWVFFGSSPLNPDTLLSKRLWKHRTKLSGWQKYPRVEVLTGECVHHLCGLELLKVSQIGTWVKLKKSFCNTAYICKTTQSTNGCLLVQGHLWCMCFSTLGSGANKALLNMLTE